MTNINPSSPNRSNLRRKLAVNGRVRQASPSSIRNRSASASSVVPDIAIVIEDYDQIQAKANSIQSYNNKYNKLDIKSRDRVARRKYWKNHDNYDYGDGRNDDGLDVYDFDDDDFGYYYDDESSVDSDKSWTSSACKLGDRDRADRLARPRMSLLGKPLNYNRGSRRDARYRRLQSRIYNFLERPRGVPAILYHVMVFLMVFTCLALSVFSTIEEYEKEALYILFRMEILVVIWFTVEFFFRLWSSGCRSRYQGSVGRLKFLKRPFCIIDVVTIAASLVVLGMGTSGQVFATSALRGLRFFQILRMVRMDRRGGTWKLLGSVVYAHRQELITTMYIGFLGLIFASFLVYLMEKDVNEKFSNFAQALWWGVITLCTVGYGDMVPETWQGKLIASFCALLGISFFALPAGILGSGFALKVQQQQRQKHMIRRRQPAATLIQSLWRCYAADEHSVSVATWKIHQVPLPSPPPSSKLEPPEKIASTSSAIFKHNASFVARLPTIRRHKSQSLHSPGNANKPPGPTRPQRCPRTMGEINASAENLEVTNNGRPLNPSLSEDSVAETAISKKNSDESLSQSPMELNRKHSAVSDTSERSDISGITSNNGGVIAASGASALPVMLCGLLQGDLLSPSDGWAQARKLLYQRSQFNMNTSNGNKAGNEDDEPRCVQLTNQHKTAIRFIRKMKYFVARRKFKEALKPYDVKDVMEQYAAGHVDLLGRVKNVQTRLDQILGKQGSKAKDVYASKISLASRVVKVERQVADIEEKLDILIKAYMQDRERFLALPLVSQVQHSNSSNQKPPGGGGGPDAGGGSGPAPGGTDGDIAHSPAGTGMASGTSSVHAATVTHGGGLKLKPILIEKQFSEPSSPIASQYEQGVPRRPPMHRGYSDLTSRIKKRVTLRDHSFFSSIPPQYVDPSSIQPGVSDDVVIVVPELDADPLESVLVARLPSDHDVCLEEDADLEPSSPKTITESSIILMDEEVEDLEEEDLDCEGEMDPESPPWDVYGEGDLDVDGDVDVDESTEDTALLRVAARTAIIVTPISPVSSAHDLARLEIDGKNGNMSCDNGSSRSSKSMDLLRPDSSSPTTRLLPSSSNSVDI
ncbi:potassium voltage-gated channel subfamily KQT member 4 isoform X3 [Episyrphus balteatus]|uniref:potassium voltage-gated channel subfamily KQT member 4 isoform X3 n=1 Tax=Episyrphus balteatus TaxID=286459 RepID=UPI002485C71E|nr:potassium voltage-gated channel subfamily KQT member 4 isoform X3 [Episyrphus balteatus]